MRASWRSCKPTKSCKIGRADEAQPVEGAGACQLARQMKIAGVGEHVLEHAEVWIEVVLLRDDAELGAYASGVAARIEA